MIINQPSLWWHLAVENSSLSSPLVSSEMSCQLLDELPFLKCLIFNIFSIKINMRKKTQCGQKVSKKPSPSRNSLTKGDEYPLWVKITIAHFTYFPDTEWLPWPREWETARPQWEGWSGPGEVASRWGSYPVDPQTLAVTDNKSPKSESFHGASQNVLWLGHRVIIYTSNDLIINRVVNN